MDAKQIKKDRLRYTKNSLSSTLTYFAILANVFYFVSIYKSDVGSYYYKWLIGVSIVYNLLFLMTAFLCSEGVKNYHLGYSFGLIVIGALQFGRIFIIPKQASTAIIKQFDKVLNENIETLVMGKGQFTFVLICLIASGTLCLVAGITGIIKTKTLNSYLKEIGVAER